MPDRIRVVLWVSREETKPELNCATANPEEMKRNMDPAWAWEMWSSSSTKGMRGAKMNRAKKFRKNRAAIKKTAPAFALKGSGIGHDLSMAHRI
jgi:hypothetical protein